MIFHSKKHQIAGYQSLKPLIMVALAIFLIGCTNTNSKKEVLNNNSLTKVDLMVKSDKVYLVDSSFSTAEMIVIDGGMIIDIGDEVTMLERYQAKKTIDATGKGVYPGFIDAHCHFVGYGLSQQQVNLIGTRSFEEVLQKVEQFSKNDTYWITGRGWDHTDWEDKSYPNKAELDRMFPDRPVAIRRVDGHALLANQKALDLAGINKASSFSGGSIEKDQNGELTGILIDEPANYLISKIPEPETKDVQRAILLAQDSCIKQGLTGFHEAGLAYEYYRQLIQLNEENKFGMFAYVLLGDTADYKNHYEEFSDENNDQIVVGGIKFYADGALGSRGACLLSAYSDVTSYNHYGKMIHGPSFYKRWFEYLKEKGGQAITHCIGDSANRVILNLYSDILGENNDRRWRIEHAQVIHPNDFETFESFNIIPSVQPTHATSDMKWSLKRLGRIRITGAYAYKQLLNQNGWLPLGTDFPVEAISPIRTFYAAVSRRKMNEMLLPPFQIENALTREEALKGMTIWAAKAGFQQKRLGSLEKGKIANITILDNDIMECDEDKIPEATVYMTIISGKVVYSDLD